MVFVIFLSLYTSLFRSEEYRSKVDSLHQLSYELMDNHPDSAFQVADQALELSQDIDYTIGIANSYYIKGYILQVIENKGASALLMYLQSGRYLKSENSKKSNKMLAEVYGNAGSILRVHGKYDEAVKLYDQVLEKIRTNDLQKNKLKILFNKAHALYDNDNLDLAIEVTQSAIALAEKVNDQKIVYDSWNLLGMINTRKEQYDLAIFCYTKVLQGVENVPVSKANSANNLGDIYVTVNQLDNAIYHYKKALSFDSKESVNGYYQHLYNFYSYCGLSKLFLEKSKLDSAVFFGKKALMLYDSITPEYQHFKIFKIMHNIHQQAGDLAVSDYYSQKYISETDRFHEAQKALLDIENSFQIDLLLASFYNEVELESKDNQYSKILILGGTIILGLTLLLFRMYKRKHSTNYQKIIEILNDVK